MTNYDENSSRLALMASLIGASGVALGTLAYLVFGNAVIEAAYDGRSFEFLNTLVAQHRASRPWATPEHYFTLGRVLFSRILLVCVVAQALIVAGFMRRRLLRFLKGFFTAATHPLNLAVFRVVLFYTIFTTVNVSYVVLLSGTPAELRVPPIGLGWLLDVLPINPVWTEVFARLLQLSSFMAMIGLRTRTSAAVTVALGFYVLGIPEFYGKVDHYHHLLWFAAILAASRCGDGFSIDALIAAWRRADRGVLEPPGESPMYGLPLRFVWLLMGLIYFFAGFWKWWSGGIDWALSDNLRFIMYQRWTEVGGWTPLFRIDHYPLLYKAAALGTIAFEISFIFLLFSRRLRLFAALGGLVFHTMTRVFMAISFATLVNCYVVFFDWRGICRRVGQTLFKEDVYLIYDGSCRLCRRTIACLQVLDLLDRVRYVDACNAVDLKHHGLAWLDPDALMADMHLVRQQKVWKGFEAYRTLVVRSPVLWPLLPFLYLWPIPKFGNAVYRRVADSRTCSIVRARSLGIVTDGRSFSTRGVAAVGSFLLCGNTLMGAAHISSSWPLACYPTFSGITERPETDLIEISMFTPAGESIPSTADMMGRYGSTKWLGLMTQAISAPTDMERRVKVAALSRMWALNMPSPPHAGRLRFYRVTISTVPEQWKANPLRRELLLELPL